MTTIFPAVDHDGDTITIHDDDIDINEGIRLTVIVRQSGDVPSAMYLDDERIDALIDTLAAYRGREVPSVETEYDLRLRAMKDARPLVQNILGIPSAQQLITVADFLLDGTLPAVGA